MESQSSLDRCVHRVRKAPFMTSKSMAYRWCKTDEVDEDLEKSGDKTDAAKNGAQKWQVRQKEAKEPQHYVGQG